MCGSNNKQKRNYQSTKKGAKRCKFYELAFLRSELDDGYDNMMVEVRTENKKQQFNNKIK